MSIHSNELIKLFNTYFEGLFLSPFTEDKNREPRVTCSEFDKYVIPQADTWTFNFQCMSQKKPFTSLFPKEAKAMTDHDWEEFRQTVTQKQKPEAGGVIRPFGGVIRPFIDRDDDQFISTFNALHPEQTLTRSIPETFSVPQTFVGTLRGRNIYGVYDWAKNDFVWDFSTLIFPGFKPNSAYDAYQRYAHAQYTTLSIGANPDSVKTMPDLLLKRVREKAMPDRLLECGYYKIEEELKEKYREYLEKYHKEKENWSNVEAIVWDIIVETLQAIPKDNASLDKKNPYPPSDLEYIKNGCFFKMIREIKRSKKASQIRMKEEDGRIVPIAGEEAPSTFDHKSREHLDRISKEILNSKNIQKRLPSGEIRNRLLQAIDNNNRKEQVMALYSAIQDPDNRKKWDKRIIDSISAEYTKLQIVKPSELDASLSDKGDDAEDSYTLADINKELKYSTLEERFENKAQREVLIHLFEQPFRIEKKFLQLIRQEIREGAGNWIVNEIIRYAKGINKGVHNKDSKLFEMFCEVSGIDREDPLAAPLHTGFSKRMNKICSLYREMIQKEEARS